MGALGKFLRTTVGGYIYWCPGCKMSHRLNTDPSQGDAWTFNGSETAPTFTPSVLIPGLREDLTQEVKDEFYALLREEPPSSRTLLSNPKYGRTICHSFVTDGKIIFLGDSIHELAGTTVSLQPHPSNLVP